MPIELSEIEKKTEQKILVQNTNREQRIEIVKKGIANVQMQGNGEVNIEVYQDYIDGKKELREIIDELISSALNDQ